MLRVIAVLAGLAPLAAGAAAPISTSARAEPGRAAAEVADGGNCRAYLPTIGATVAVPCPDQRDAPAARTAPPVPEKQGGSGAPAEPDTSRPAQPPAPQRSMTAAHTAPPALSTTAASRDECRHYEPYLGRTIAIACQETAAAAPSAAKPSPSGPAGSPAKPQPATANARITPAATPAPAPVAVGGGTSSCTALVERAQLGNPLSIDDRERLRFECRR